MLSGSINGVAINGTVTGTADRETGRVTNVFHDIDPAIGPELSSMGIGQTIVCAHMAVEEGAARNLISKASALCNLQTTVSLHAVPSDGGVDSTQRGSCYHGIFWNSSIGLWRIAPDARYAVRIQAD